MGVQWITDRGDIWKQQAKSLQLQLRDRFRIAVDRHRHRHPIFSDENYFSSRFRRLCHRLHHLRTRSLPSSNSVFYRKRVCGDLYVEEESKVVRMLQAVAVPVIGNACHVFMNGLNRVQVYGVEKLHQALLNRPKDKSLLTVSNHVASVDDPFVIASLLPPSVLLDAKNLRWTLCASDRCFTNPVTSAFFRCVKVLPVARGDGLYQKGMDMAIAKLNNGGWVHIFPEGSRSRDGGRTIGSAKRGVGRLVLDAEKLPMVVPFVHSGMQEIMPVGAKFPRIGKTVTVLIGDPIHFDDLMAEGVENVSRENLYDAVSLRIGHRLHELKAQVDRLVLQQSIQLQNHPQRNMARAAEVLHQLDWESFGMGSSMAYEDDLSPKPEKHVQPEAEDAQPQQPTWSSPHERFFRYEGGILSRIRGYMDPTELMGFAARGLFVNSRREENSPSVGQIIPLKAWKQFLIYCNNGIHARQHHRLSRTLLSVVNME